MSATERVQVALDSSPPNWNTVTLQDVRHCIDSKIGRYKELRRYRDQANGVEETQSIANDLKRLFPALAQKYAQRGRADLDAAIRDLEQKMAEPDRINPFDDVYLNALRAEAHQFTQTES